MSTKSLLHFDGAHNSTNFIDETGKIWTPAGNAKLTTATYVFPSASGIFDGASYISTPPHDDFNFWASDFTVDFRFKRSSINTQQQIFAVGEANTESFAIRFTPENYIYIWRAYSGGASNVLQYLTPFTDTANWHHMATVRSGNDWLLFIDGANVLSNNNSLALANNTASIYIGGANNVYAGYNGGLDEFRVSRHAVWTSPFTPPTTPYVLFHPRIIMIGE